MERVELLGRAEGMPVATAYVQVTVGAAEYRLYPAAGTRARWIGRVLMRGLRA